MERWKQAQRNISARTNPCKEHIKKQPKYLIWENIIKKMSQLILTLNKKNQKR